MPSDSFLGLCRRSSALLLTGTLLALGALSSCQGSGSASSPAAGLRPGDPVYIELVRKLGSGQELHLVIVNDSLFAKMRGEKSLPTNLSRHSDENIIDLVRDFQTTGFFRFAQSAPPAADCSYLAMRIQGRNHYLANPLQGGPKMQGMEWANSIGLFQVAYNAGKRYRGEVNYGNRRAFDPGAEKQRLLRENQRAQQRLQQQR
ncbi:MAG: hypothetical protein CSA62_13965 [Planctomycetota bacterium]|nr:MAG: hypothetical protein CSA62_13965 [Planctomycetota bacterium]